MMYAAVMTRGWGGQLIVGQSTDYSVCQDFAQRMEHLMGGDWKGSVEQLPEPTVPDSVA